MNWITLLAILRRRRRFRWFSLGLLTSRAGDTFNLVALSWLTLEISGPRQLGTVLLLAGVPRALSSPVTGHLIDRFGARPVLFLDNLGRAILVSLIPTLLWLQLLRVEHLYVLAFLTALLSMGTEIGQSAVVPALVDEDGLGAANTLLSVIFDVSEWAGPALAGAVIQYFGVAFAFLLDAVSFLVMCVVAAALPRRTPSGEGKVTRASTRPFSLLIGFQALWKLRAAAVMTCMAFGALLTSGMMQVFLPAYSREVLDVGALGYGGLVSVAGFGSLLGTVLLTPPLLRLMPAVSVALTFFVRGLFLLPLAFTAALPSATALVLLSGLGDGPFYPLDRTIMQRAVPASLRGRVFGARGSLCSIGFPVGAALGGLMLAVVGPRSVVATIALASLPMMATGLVARGLLGKPPARLWRLQLSPSVSPIASSHTQALRAPGSPSSC